MKIKARRGVCIGVDRHLQAGDLADLDASQVTFLAGIGAVEIVPEVPAPTIVLEEAELKTVGEGKETPASKEPEQKSIELDAVPTQGTSRKKEK
jgi:hypothetical protein